jgi:hypothetical protein
MVVALARRVVAAAVILAAGTIRYSREPIKFAV